MAIVLAALAGAASGVRLVFGYTLPVVLEEWDGGGARATKAKIRGPVAPLAELNFDDGEWSAYILLERNDFREVKGRLPRNCMRLSDRDELKRLQRELTANATGGDMATVLSSLVFVRNGRVAFATGIVLDGEDLVGLQTRTWGFLKPERRDVRVGFANRFTPFYWPIVVLW
jgi:hypothetical protein